MKTQVFATKILFMKPIIHFISIILISSLQPAFGQQKSNDEIVIRDFLNYISAPKWNIDTVTSKYVLFYQKESKVASRVTRKFYLGMAVSELAEKIKNVKLDDLKIVPYNEAEEKFRKMLMAPEYLERSYVVTDTSGKFTRYFLLKDGQIEGFVLFQDKTFLLLN